MYLSIICTRADIDEWWATIRMKKITKTNNDISNAKQIMLLQADRGMAGRQVNNHGYIHIRASILILCFQYVIYNL